MADVEDYAVMVADWDALPYKSAAVIGIAAIFYLFAIRVTPSIPNSGHEYVFGSATLQRATSGAAPTFLRASITDRIPTQIVTETVSRTIVHTTTKTVTGTPDPDKVVSAVVSRITPFIEHRIAAIGEELRLQRMDIVSYVVVGVLLAVLVNIFLWKRHVKEPNVDSQKEQPDRNTDGRPERTYANTQTNGPYAELKEEHMDEEPVIDRTAAGSDPVLHPESADGNDVDDHLYDGTISSDHEPTPEMEEAFEDQANSEDSPKDEDLTDSHTKAISFDADGIETYHSGSCLDQNEGVQEAETPSDRETTLSNPSPPQLSSIAKDQPTETDLPTPTITETNSEATSTVINKALPQASVNNPGDAEHAAEGNALDTPANDSQGSLPPPQPVDDGVDKRFVLISEELQDDQEDPKTSQPLPRSQQASVVKEAAFTREELTPSTKFKSLDEVVRTCVIAKSNPAGDKKKALTRVTDPYKAFVDYYHKKGIEQGLRQEQYGDLMGELGAIYDWIDKLNTDQKVLSTFLTRLQSQLGDHLKRVQVVANTAALKVYGVEAEPALARMQRVSGMARDHDGLLQQLIVLEKLAKLRTNDEFGDLIMNGTTRFRKPIKQPQTWPNDTLLVMLMILKSEPWIYITIEHTITENDGNVADRTYENAKKCRGIRG